MFFLLRCIFWLGIVFHAMDWGLATPAATATVAFGEVARSAVSVAVSSAAPAVRDLCLAKPGSCLALVTHTALLPPTPASAATPMPARAVAHALETLTPPLPPRRPRGIS